MNVKVVLLSLVVVALALSGCGPKEWTEFSSGPGNFSVLLPGTPEEQTQSVDTPAGSIDIHMFLLDQGSSAFMVGYSDYPESLIAQADPMLLLDGARDGAVGNVGGTMRSERELTLNSNPGREIKFDVPDSSDLPGGGYAVARLYLVQNRLYQVIGMAKKDVSEEEIIKFLDSFTLAQ